MPLHLAECPWTTRRLKEEGCTLGVLHSDGDDRDSSEEASDHRELKGTSVQAARMAATAPAYDCREPHGGAARGGGASEMGTAELCPTPLENCIETINTLRVEIAIVG